MPKRNKKSLKGTVYKFFQENVLSFLILILAAGLRFSLISDNPPSLNWDEVSHGYNAYSILTSGKDEWGKLFPLIFRAYGDYKLPVYIYLTSISEFFLGLTPLAVRLPSVMAGIATVFFTYLLTKELFGKKVSLLASLLVAVEPWSLFLSRGAFEANLALALIVAGTYFFIKGMRTSCCLLIATILFGLSVWTYNSARIFTPLLLVLLVLIYRKELLNIYKKKFYLIHTLLLVILAFFLPMFWQLANPVGQARYGWVAILDEGAIAQINEARAKSSFSPTVSRLFYNKATYFTRKFVTNYFSHFSVNFLFLKGGNNYQFSVPGRGLLFLINLPFFLIGLVLLARKRNEKSLVVLVWLFISPVASSLTREAPHVLRSIVMIPMPMVISALGFMAVFDWLARLNSKINKISIKYTILMAYFIVLGALVEDYLSFYFNDYRKAYSWAWQYGYKQAVDYVKPNYTEYDKVVVTKKYGEPHEFFLFYGGVGNLAPWPWEPQEYRNDPNLIRFYQTNWYWVDRFDKFYFVNDWEIPKEGYDFVLESGKTVDCNPSFVSCLLITSPGNAPTGWRKIKVINFLDNNPAFEIYNNTLVSM